ncbi:MAG: hypothetical protein HWE27_15010 [Gammaproteobacteria bacterium]|nr:hypothetical protein [Gammaproteobacteria bacterium]
MLHSNCRSVGIESASLVLFVPHRPTAFNFHSDRKTQALDQKAMSHFLLHCDNHWKKIINCFAKISYDLYGQSFESWQSYRDTRLLTKNSQEQILFPDIDGHFPERRRQNTSIASEFFYSDHDEPIGTSNKKVELISGLVTARKLSIDLDSWDRTAEFFFRSDDSGNPYHIVTPYFDYRQLSNQKINRLLNLLTHLK